MGWNLEGLRVTATYLDSEYTITGRVESSRVKYGGNVQHTVMLDEATEIYGNVRDRLLIKHKDVIKIESN